MVENPFAPVEIPGAPDLGPDRELEEMHDSFERMPPEEQEEHQSRDRLFGGE